MKISVIIPTYKPKEYLWECLNSLISQTLSKNTFEIIIVLNGCYNPWYLDIERYIHDSMHGMNVKFIHTSESGVSNARNIALREANGEFITFIDDDDYVSPEYLSELLRYSSSNFITIAKPLAFNDETKEQVSYPMTGVFLRNFMRGPQNFLSSRKFFSGPCMKLIPKRIIQNRQFDIRFRNGEDSLFLFLISDKIDKVNYASDKAIYYRRFRENSAVTTKRTFKERLVNSLSLIKEYSQIFFSALGRYNFIFFITRILGALRSVIN